jgi:hypothetical protein
MSVSSRPAYSLLGFTSGSIVPLAAITKKEVE